MMMGIDVAIVDGMNQLPTSTKDSELETHVTIDKAWLEAQWQGNSLDMLILNIQGEGFHKYHFWLLADREDIARGINSCQICRTNHDNRVLAALISSSFPGVPSTFQ